MVERGLTLTELMITTVVIGIIMAGVLSSDIAVRRQSNAAFNNTLSSLNVQAMVERIIASATLAVGDSGNPGIVFNANPQNLCFRQDLNLDGSAHNPITPANYADDRFACYTVSAGSLLTCNLNAAGACVNGAGGVTTLGQVNNINSTFAPNNAQGGQMVFTVTITVTDGNGTRALSASVTPVQYSM